MIGWNFPLNNSGQITGLNDAGIQTFLDNTIQSLAREINQNSLDAHDPGTKRPVEVHFQLSTVSSALFPNRDEFLQVLQSCKLRWAGYEKAQEFFENALSIMGDDKITVLKISDFYTTGLTGSHDEENGNWVGLTKSVGASNKEEGAGGSFGIGKHAAYACSPLRVVFYGTRDEEGFTAFQGVAKLVTHADKEGRMTQGTGYFGETSKNTPLIKLDQLDPFFHRELVGTDLYIFGFDAADGWKDKIAASVLENYFVAIHENRLIVRVDDELINSTNLADLISRYFSGDNGSNCASYFEAFTSNDSQLFVKEDFEGMGRIEMHILPKQHFPKRVAMLRKTGMLVFEKGHFQTPMKFAGVLRATGDAINEFLCSLEPPTHNSWHPTRHKNQRYAEQIIRSLYKWMNDQVKTLSSLEQQEEYDFEGMQQYLPDDMEDNPKQQDSESHQNTVPAEVELEIRQSKAASQPSEHKPSQQGGAEDDGGAQVGGDEGDSQNKGGNAKNQGTGGGGDDEDGGGDQNENGEYSAPSRSPVTLKKTRAFCSDPDLGNYKVIFETVKSGTGFITLKIVGEVEELDAPVVGASIDGQALNISSRGDIGPLQFIEGGRQELVVRLGNKMHCALEVAAYEDN